MDRADEVIARVRRDTARLMSKIAAVEAEIASQVDTPEDIAAVAALQARLDDLRARPDVAATADS